MVIYDALDRAVRSRLRRRLHACQLGHLVLALGRLVGQFAHQALVGLAGRRNQGGLFRNRAQIGGQR